MTGASIIHSLVSPHVVTDGSAFRLHEVDPGSKGILDASKSDADDLLARGIERLAELQDMLYAQDRWALLAMFQAMDAAGKDGAIKHVMSGVNPQGVQVYSFKAPSAEELDHDWMWRCMVRLPERGRIGIWNRSWYEEVLAVRVHPQFLAKQKLPPRLVTDGIWEDRFEDIRCVERYLARNGIVIRKFFLHVSREEQKERFLARLDEPEKHWKFSAADIRERGHWDEYMRYYDELIRATATPEAPWVVVPADRKWYARLVVAATLIDALESLQLHYPEVTDEHRQSLDEARKKLKAD